MKINKIILPVVASAMLLTGCDDQIMEWGLQDGHTAVTSADLPLAVKEVLANYDDIKVYSAANHPNMKLGLGIGAAIYQGEDGRHELAKDNFQMVTWGNAMKMDALMKSNGDLNFANLDPALDKLKKDGIDLYGHNFFWHTQQQQSYLRSVIAPKMILPASDGDKCENVITNSGFEDGNATGWTGWSHYSRTVVEGGHDSDYALKCEMDGETSQNWDCQLWWPLAENLQAGVTYYYGVWVKSPDNINVQFIGQNASYSGLYKGTVTATSEWTLLEGEFTYDGNPADVVRIGLQFGGTPNSVVFVDDFQFGKKVEDPMDNVITNSNFDDGTANGWTGWSHYTRTVEEGGHSGKYALKCTMDGETSQNWDCPLWWPLAENLQAGTIYSYSFYIKSPDAVVAQFIGQNESYSGLYKLSFTAPEEWLKCEGEFTYDGNPADVVRIGLQFGGKPNSVLWVDDFKFGKKKDQTPAAGSRRAGGITFEAKTAEEKNQLLTEVMENWVKGVAEHLAAKEIVPVAYDVINEAIADGSNGVRGLNGVFGGSITDDDGNVTYDSAPVETEEDGLTLNWGSGHWYWGYYVPDYAVKAFQFARKYLPASTKLFYNDYNLESSDSKRAAAIQFVKDIDEANGSPIVDGIGTQMHVSFSPTDDADENAEKLAELKARVDKQFQELAATGKLVRVTELDISVNTGSPSAAQYKAQADAYQLIFESYFENVPEAQQSGITIWSLTDAEDEHEYWLKGQVPNLWDASFKRKWAYKGVCDALAGEDVGLTFGSETYKVYYEKNNVSDTVK